MRRLACCTLVLPAVRMQQNATGCDATECAGVSRRPHGALGSAIDGSISKPRRHRFRRVCAATSLDSSGDIFGLAVNETPWKPVLTMPQLGEHRRPQDLVQPALIAAALTLEPFDHVGIDAHRQLSLHGAIELSALCSAPVTLTCRWHVREVDLGFRLGGQCRQLIGNGGFGPLWSPSTRPTDGGRSH